MKKSLKRCAVLLLCIFTFSLIDTTMFTIIAKADTTLTPIMGQGSLNKNQMINSLLNRNKRLTVREIRDFVDFTISEANIEGVNYDILFSQMMLETNYLNFGGDVQASQNNFAGIGATGGGNPGNSFPTVQIGIRAVVQHLKAYASTEPLKQTCVDPRFQYVKRGTAEYVEHLGIQENPNGTGWATAKDYGKSILNLLSNIRTLSSTQQYSLITSFNVVGDRTTKSTLSISVGAELSGDTLYRIAAVDRSTDQWQILSEWSTNNKATYIPVNPGTHRIAVYTKHKNKTGTVEDDYKYIDLDIQLSTSSIKSLNVTGELYAKSQLTITSDAIPSDKTLYKIMAVDRSTEKWTTISDWSTTKSAVYTPVNPGTHRVVVYVKHTDKKGDAEDDYKFVDLYIKPAVSNVNSLEITGNKMVQSELKISANADPASNTLYKIMAVDRNTEKWVTLSDWSTTKSVTYTPVNPGTHRVAVYVKHKNKIGNIEDDYKYVDLNIDSPKSKVTGLNITGEYYAKSSLSVMATASPDDASMYKIMAVDRSTEKWVTLSNWSTKNSVTYTPVNPGTHRVVVYVKHKNVSGDVYSDYKYVDLSIKPAVSAVAAFQIVGDRYINTPLTINASADPASNTLYKIMAVDRNTEKWVTLSDWSTTKSVTYTPVNPGTHRVTVYVKHKDKKGDIEDDYKYVDLNIDSPKSKVTGLNITGEYYAKSSLSVMATASPDDASMYKIMAVDRSTEKWVTLSDWSTTKSVTYTPVNPGTHRVVVYVKHKSVTGDVYSDYKYVDINIKPAKSTVTSLEVSGKVALGETVTIKAAASPSENTLYKIMAVDRSTEEWVTLSNWSTRNQVTYTFKNNAQYRFVVYVKHSSKNQDTEDDYRYVDVSTLKGTIVIDPGHGGSDPGAIGNGFLEKNGTLDISFKLKSKLENLGYKVYITRSDDSYVDLYDRARLANNVKADLLVSIHHNSFSETSTGIEVLYSARDMDRNIRNEAINSGWPDPDITYAARVSTSSTIAKDLSANLASALGMVNRGAKEQNLAVCRNTAMPSILVEAGFISNPNDCSIVMSSFGQDLITTTIANVISKYIK